MFVFVLAGGPSEGTASPRRRVIIVGVDDSAEAEAAARWAVHEAELRMDDLLLVHAYEVPRLPPHGRVAGLKRGREQRLSMLDKIADLIVPPTMHLDQLVEVDSPESLLPRLSEKAEFTVLGHDHPRLVGRMPFGHGEHGRQLVEASCCCGAARLGGKAQRQGARWPWPLMGGTLRPARWATPSRASLRRVPVLVIHAASLAELSPGEQDTRVNLAEILAGWKTDYPDIDVDTLLLAGSPRDAVATVSAEAQLLVVGSPYRGREWARWIRSVARAVLDQATCPVAVVPQRRPRSATAD
jgi:nucleotide-binding universal stress UspA family protein